MVSNLLVLYQVCTILILRLNEFLLILHYVVGVINMSQ